MLHILKFPTHSLPLSVHDGFQLLKVSQFNLKLLHLSFHQQSHQRFDLPLFHCSQMLWGERRRLEKIKTKKAEDWRYDKYHLDSMNFTLALTAAAARAEAAAVARFPSPTSRSTLAFLSPSLSPSLCPSSVPSFPSFSFSPSPMRNKSLMFFTVDQNLYVCNVLWRQNPFVPISDSVLSASLSPSGSLPLSSSFFPFSACFSSSSFAPSLVSCVAK